MQAELIESARVIKKLHNIHQYRFQSPQYLFLLNWLHSKFKIQDILFYTSIKLVSFNSICNPLKKRLSAISHASCQAAGSENVAFGRDMRYRIRAGLATFMAGGQMGQVNGLVGLIGLSSVLTSCAVNWVRDLTIRWRWQRQPHEMQIRQH